jgi:hypothetical protein
MILKITITYFIICALMGIIALLLDVSEHEDVGGKLGYLSIVLSVIGMSTVAIVGLIYSLWTVWT